MKQPKMTEVAEDEDGSEDGRRRRNEREGRDRGRIYGAVNDIIVSALTPSGPERWKRDCTLCFSLDVYSSPPSQSVSQSA